MEVDFSKQIKELKQDFRKHCMDSSEASEIVSLIIAQKTEKHNETHENKVSEDQLKKVYFRGSKSYDLSFRMGKTRSQWAMARVNLFLKMNRGEDVEEPYLIADKDILVGNEQADASLDTYCFDNFSDIDLNLASLDLIKAGIEKWDQDFDCEDILYSEAEKKTLNKPFRLKDSEKKFGVYVLSKGNYTLVKFGEEEPHGLDGENSINKTNPKYWAKQSWQKKAINESISSEAVEWDEEELVSEWGWNEDGFLDQDYFEDYDHLKDCKEIEEKGI
jgi:hypothetical protein